MAVDLLIRVLILTEVLMTLVLERIVLGLGVTVEVYQIKLLFMMQVM